MEILSIMFTMFIGLLVSFRIPHGEDLDVEGLAGSWKCD
jgi:hypothetical protein